MAGLFIYFLLKKEKTIFVLGRAATTATIWQEAGGRLPYPEKSKMAPFQKALHWRKVLTMLQRFDPQRRPKNRFRTSVQHRPVATGWRDVVAVVVSTAGLTDSRRPRQPRLQLVREAKPLRQMQTMRCIKF